MKNRHSLYPLLSGIGLIMIFLASSAWLAFHPDINADHVRYMVDHSRRVLAYKTTNNRETLFRIHPQDEQIEILSNLDISENLLSGTSTETTPTSWEYALEIRLLDADMNTIRTEIYWKKTKMTDWVEKETGNPMKSAYYLYEDTMAADSRITTMQVHDRVGEERFLAIKVHSPGNASASVRAYRHLDLTTESDIKGLRLMPKRFRSKLIRHNVFGSDLHREELARSMRDVLSQIPAETRQGFEYSTRQLFLYEDVSPQIGCEPPSFSTDSSLSAPFYFPVNGPAKLTVVVENKESIQASILLDDVLLSETTRSPDINGHVQFDFGPGAHLLKIVSPGNDQKLVSVDLDPATAWYFSDVDQADAFPVSTTAYYRVMTLENNTPVQIALPKVPTESSGLFKMVCRLPFAPSEISEELLYSMEYTYYDSQDNILDEGIIQGITIPSSMARYQSVHDISSIPSVPNRWYFNPPPDATYMELTASRAIDVAFYAQIELLDSTENHYGPAGQAATSMEFRYRDADVSGFGDYYFRPINAAELNLQNRKMRIALPNGLLESSQVEEIASSLTTLESCYPRQTTRIDSVYDWVTDDSRTDSSYIRFFSGEAVAITIGDSIDYARPAFQYSLNPTMDPIITVKVDNIIVSEFRPITFEGYFEIPLLETGTHRLTVTTPDPLDQIFMKAPPNVFSDQGYYVSRQVFKLAPGETLTLPYHKTSWDSAGLNIIAYRESHDGLPVVLDLTANLNESHQPVSAVSKASVRFVGNPDSSGIAVPSSFGKTLTSPERFFYQLHDDQAPDIYSLAIKSQSNNPVYLRFFTHSSSPGQPS